MMLWVAVLRRSLGLTVVGILLAACHDAVVENVPLPHDAQGRPHYEAGYALATLLPAKQDDLILVLAFSGGGKRSAAFAHGALRGLRQIPAEGVGGNHTMLDAATYIAAVSGGSFAAAHYGLYGAASFDSFPGDFLKQDIESYIWGTYLLPWNWAALFASRYGTNDRMAEVYDQLMFHGATFNDLMRRGLPLISINATDIANGYSFAFTQPNFDLLCADLGPFPIARAVAASNGLPVLFSPITLTSHTAQCQGERPPSAPVLTAAQVRDELSRRTQVARVAERYIDPSRTAYVHLLDGGLSDNLALRALLNGLLTVDDSTPRFRAFAPKTRRILIVSIDGQSASDPHLPKEPTVTGLGQIIGAASGAPIDAYNFETRRLAQQELDELRARVERVRCGDAGARPRDCDVRAAFVHIGLANVTDAAERERLQAIPTGLTIPDADVDALVQWGERLVRDNPTIRAMAANRPMS